MSRTLREWAASGGRFQAYAYAYPHKTAYRRLQPPRELAEVWSGEDRSALFLYVHAPFCEARCGFCNLFTTTSPGAGLVGRYLDALERQAEAVAEALGGAARVARVAIGGGTPSFLTGPELARLDGILRGHFGAAEEPLPRAIEASPGTVGAEKIAQLRSLGFTRVSLGVQSFVPAELRALGRPETVANARRALELLAAAKFPCLNVDLIYGMPGQTPGSWQTSLDEALAVAPQEIYLYPLYVRPLTGLDRRGHRPTDERLALYRQGRDYLREQGYRQISLRLFRREDYQPAEGPVYCCQEDGMVGLGPGARSYTTALHYSSEYAVGRAGVGAVIADFLQRSRREMSRVDYGFALDREEQQRRYVLKSLLRAEGLDRAAYQAFFGTTPDADFPELAELLAEGWARAEEGKLQLTEAGLEFSDVVGPWLWSARVREEMARFELR